MTTVTQVVRVTQGAVSRQAALRAQAFNSYMVHNNPLSLTTPCFSLTPVVMLVSIGRINKDRRYPNRCSDWGLFS